MSNLSLTAEHRPSKEGAGTSKTVLTVLLSPTHMRQCKYRDAINGDRCCCLLQLVVFESHQLGQRSPYSLLITVQASSLLS